MPEKNLPSRKLSDKNTKQEMLDAYQVLVKQLEEKREAGLNPEKQLEDKKAAEAVQVAEALAPETVDRDIVSLKSDIGRMLAETAEKLAAEVAKYRSIQKAIAVKEKELAELYDIGKSAASLAALIEAQNQKRREFDAELTEQKAELARDIDEHRAEWEKEKRQHDLELKEREAAEKKTRERDKEQYDYQFKRDQQALRDQLNDEKQKQEKELRQKRETAEKELAEREKNVVEKEKELAQLRERAAAYPKELESAVARAVQEISERLKLESKNREELLRKDFEGQSNVLKAKIEVLEKTVKEANESNARLSRQLDTAYQKVQEIAEKAIEGSAQSKTLAEVQKLLAEQTRKPATEKS